MVIDNVSLKYIEIAMIITIYLPQFIMSYFILTHRDALHKIYSSIKSQNYSVIFLTMISIIFDFVASINIILIYHITIKLIINLNQNKSSLTLR